MVSLVRIRESPATAAARTALIACILLGVAACDTTLAGDGWPFVLTTRGDEVQANSPPGVEVTLGAKRVRQADEPPALD
jgi:hypothetical protein